MDGHVSTLSQEKLIIAYDEKVTIGSQVFHNVPLKEFLSSLTSTIQSPKAAIPKVPQFLNSQNGNNKNASRISDAQITVESFFDTIDEIIPEGMTYIAETGDSLFGSGLRKLKHNSRYIAQARYLSLGFGTPAVLGAGLADPQSRVIAFIGDGGFQVSAQEASSWIRYGVKPIVFLLNNEGYVTERIIHDGVHQYNEIPPWNYSEIFKLFGRSHAVKVKTASELFAAIRIALLHAELPVFIEVMLERDNTSQGLKTLAEKVHTQPHLEYEIDII